MKATDIQESLPEKNLLNVEWDNIIEKRLAAQRDERHVPWTDRIETMKLIQKLKPQFRQAILQGEIEDIPWEEYAPGLMQTIFHPNYFRTYYIRPKPASFWRETVSYESFMYRARDCVEQPPAQGIKFKNVIGKLAEYNCYKFVYTFYKVRKFYMKLMDAIDASWQRLQQLHIDNQFPLTPQDRELIKLFGKTNPLSQLYLPKPSTYLHSFDVVPADYSPEHANEGVSKESVGAVRYPFRDEPDAVIRAGEVVYKYRDHYIRFKHLYEFITEFEKRTILQQDIYIGSIYLGTHLPFAELELIPKSKWMQEKKWFVPAVEYVKQTPNYPDTADMLRWVVEQYHTQFVAKDE